MFAVFRHGGKQYKATQDAIFEIEKIPGEVGDVVSFDDVVLCSADNSSCTTGDQVGSAKVSAEIVNQKRQSKIIVFKKKRRQNYRRTRGHKQQVTVVKVKAIEA